MVIDHEAVPKILVSATSLALWVVDSGWGVSSAATSHMVSTSASPVSFDSIPSAIVIEFFGFPGPHMSEGWQQIGAYWSAVVVCTDVFFVR